MSDWKPGDTDRREHQVYVERKSSTIERSIIYILQALILGGLIWVGNSILMLRESTIRIETRNESTMATNTRVENGLHEMRKQLQLTDAMLQAAGFRIDDHERRLKGLELVKERMR